MCVHVNVWCRMVSLGARGAEVGGVQLHTFCMAVARKYLSAEQQIGHSICRLLLDEDAPGVEKGRTTQVIEGR